VVVKSSSQRRDTCVPVDLLRIYIYIELAERGARAFYPGATRRRARAFIHDSRHRRRDLMRGQSATDASVTGGEFRGIEGTKPAPFRAPGDAALPRLVNNFVAHFLLLRKDPV